MPGDDVSYSPIEVAVALSLYGYNVSPAIRTMRLVRHFNGDCMEPEDLCQILSGERVAYAATELPQPTAEVYVAHALEHYGAEARERVRVNRGAPV